VNPLCLLPGWCIELIRVDETHCVKLGVARCAVAAGIVDLLQRGAWTPAGLAGNLPLEEGLKHAWSAFRSWCHQAGIYSNARQFTRDRLGISTLDFAESASKAYNTRVLVAWLADAATHIPDADASDHTRMIALHFWSMHELFLAMEEVKDKFFDANQASRFCNAGQHHCIVHGCV
jgi:hypothetical protein